jgi:hypothetical protein
MYSILFTATGVSPDLMYVNVPVITNLVCMLTYTPFLVVSSTLCTSGAEGRGPCNVSYAQCLRYRRINFTNFQHLTHQTNLVLR